MKAGDTSTDQCTPRQSKKSVLLPSPENVKLAAELLRGNSTSPVNQYFEDRNKKGWFENQETLFLSMLQFYFIKTGKGDLSIWNTQHFNCRMEAYFILDADPEEKSRNLKTIVSEMETFGRYHMCDSFFINANKGDGTFLESLGYHKQLNADLPRQDNVKARYNLYTKKYPSMINLYEV